MSTVAACGVRACEQPSNHVGPRTGAQLCQAHFDKEVQKLTEQKDSLVEKLRLLLDSTERAQLRAEQSSLESEVEDVCDMFDAIEESQWKQRTVSRVQAVLNSVAGRLKDTAEAEQCERDIMVASDAGDMKKVMELTASAELWLEEASERSEQFKEARAKLRERQAFARQGLGSDAIVRSVGDVAAGVQELRLVMDRHMAGVLKQCWLDEGETKPETPVCQFFAEIDKIVDFPCHLASCTNTANFGGDNLGRIVRVEPGKSTDTIPMPEPCIFVSFNEASGNSLLVTSLDGAVRLEYHTDLQWKDWISGLFCDSERQLLFLAQVKCVTVTDLSGEVKRVITAATLNLTDMSISAIAGNMDKVFLLNVETSCVHKISIESTKLECTLNVGAFNVGQLDELALHGDKILLVDCVSNKVYKICGISGQLVSIYPTKENEFFQSARQVAVDSRGILFAVETDSNKLSALSSSGQVLQTVLGTPDEAGDEIRPFLSPASLAVVKSAEMGHFLALADYNNCRICVFLLG